MPPKNQKWSTPKRPPMLTKSEIQLKLSHLRTTLAARKKTGILFTAEGAMRWLTGLRHQILDMLPDADSPVQALVETDKNSTKITLLTTRIEMPRVKDQIPPLFKGVRNVKIAYAQSCPKTKKSVLLPADPLYNDTLGAIVRPLLGAKKDNPYKKLNWLSGMTTALLAKTAHEIEVGMNGAQVRGLLYKNFAEHTVECNMFLVCLKGQESHFHPLYDEKYKVTKKSWIKLVAGGRYAEHIVSATVMVNIGGSLTKKVAASYAALQEGVVAYADLYRNGVSEKEIYPQVGKRFNAIARKHGLKGWGKSAYFHHMGGPTSPLGNRDFILTKDGTQTCFPGMQFAINPVEVLGETKVEVQGIVTESGAPEMLDFSIYTPESWQTFRKVESEFGTTGMIPDLIVRD